MSKQAFQSQSEFSQQQTWYSGTVTNQEVVTMSQKTQKTLDDVSSRLSFSIKSKYGVIE